MNEIDKNKKKQANERVKRVGMDGLNCSVAEKSTEA